MDTFYSFVSDNGFWGTLGWLWIAGLGFYFLRLIVYRSSQFSDAFRVLYYSGHPSLDVITEGALEVLSDRIRFVPDESGRSALEIPYAHLGDVRSKTRDQGEASLVFQSSTYGLAGAIRYLLIDYFDAEGVKGTIEFAMRAKSNKAAVLRRLILEAAGRSTGVSVKKN